MDRRPSAREGGGEGVGMGRGRGSFPTYLELSFYGRKVLTTGHFPFVAKRTVPVSVSVDMKLSSAIVAALEKNVAGLYLNSKTIKIVYIFEV